MQMVLMDDKNARLRQCVYAKKTAKKPVAAQGHACHMASAEMLEDPAKEDRRKSIKDVHRKAAKLLKAIQISI